MESLSDPVYRAIVIATMRAIDAVSDICPYHWIDKETYRAQEDDKIIEGMYCPRCTGKHNAAMLRKTNHS